MALPDDVPRYALGDEVVSPGSVGFEEALARVHLRHGRPRCMCQPEGVPMYIARLGDGFIVKRMPFTGHCHAPGCGSYEPPLEMSGRGEVAPAIREDLTTGCTALRVEFALCQRPGRAAPMAAGELSGSAHSPGSRLTLRGLLHYLWEQAELNRWHPGFEGRRPWAAVRRHLLRAAQTTLVGGQPLAQRLYVPEVFSAEQREALAQRRRLQWASALPRPGQPQPLLLVLAELKQLLPARYGHQAVIKHLPEVAFGLDAALARRLTHRFEEELATWSADRRLHLVLLATAVLSEHGLPSVVEVTLMLTTAAWLPVDNAWEAELLNSLVHEGRRFTKPMRYQLAAAERLPTAVLADTETPPTLLNLVDGSAAKTGPEDTTAWRWSPLNSSMPALPPRRKGLRDPLRLPLQEGEACGSLDNWLNPPPSPTPRGGCCRRRCRHRLAS